jgi:hypothetical protein
MKEWSHQLKEIQFVLVSRTSLNLRVDLQNYVHFASFCPSSIDHKSISSSVYKVAGGNVVATATRNRLEGSGLELRLGQEIFFLHANPDRHWVSHIDLYKGSYGSFAGVKRPGCDLDHSPPFNAEFKSGDIRLLPLFVSS